MPKTHLSVFVLTLICCVCVWGGAVALIRVKVVRLTMPLPKDLLISWG
jgi:hypothetical protein